MEKQLMQQEHKASARGLIKSSLKKWWLPVPQAFRKDHLEYQHHHNTYFHVLITIIGYLAYWSYGIADYLVAPDIARMSIITRSIFVFFALPASIWMIRRFKNVFIAEFQASAFTTIAAVIWFELLLHSSSSYISTYVYASVIFVVLLNIGVRVCFALVALPFSLLLSGIILYYVYLLDGKDQTVWFIFCLAFLPVLLFSLFISWHNAYVGRRLFLYSVINRLNKHDLEEANQTLWTQSHTDHLTGVPNRALFNDRIQQALIRARRDLSVLALMFVDLDKFKPVNDTYGHAMGDLLLKEVARRMVACVREADLVARVGGDEFVVMLPFIEAKQDAERVAEKIRLALGKPFLIEGIELSIGSSIGVAVFPEHGSDADALSACADAALYRAKRMGRNRIEMAVPQDRDGSRRHNDDGL